jgi:hypothetical protein
MASGVYRRNDSNNGWVDYNSNNEIRVRNGSNNGWLTPPSSGMIFRRNGSNNGWEQIYPLGVVPQNGSSSVGSSGMNTKQSRYNSWKTGVSRQGWNQRDSGGYEQFGVINASSSGYAGRGSIVDSGTWTFSGHLNSSGNYNYNQTITFRGCNYSGGTGSSESPFGTGDSNTMTITWKATGADTPIPSTQVAINGSAALNWLNNVNSYGNKMCMYNGETSAHVGNSYSKDWSNNYLGISAYNMSISQYKYASMSYKLDRPESASHMFSMFSGAGVPKDDNYLNISLPENFDYESTEQLIQMYESEEIEYVTSDKCILYKDFDYKPVILSIENNIVYTSPIFDDNVFVQYKIDDEWVLAFNFEPRRYLIKDRASSIRLIDLFTEEIFYEIIK